MNTVIKEGKSETLATGTIGKEGKAGDFVMSAVANVGDRSVFAGFHPALNFIYFGYVALITVFFLHPVLLSISFISALAWSAYLGGARARRFGLCFVLPVMLIAAAFNPAFNHRGVTILFYFRDNPITLESIIYGLCTAVMIGGIILWFLCYNYVISSDKLIYLFGRAAPAMALIVSMALRFIPMYVVQARRVASARRGIGLGVSGSFMSRVKGGGKILSVMVTWALENAVETSDSMRSRGYGLPGRTAYSVYRFGAGDRTALIALLAMIAIVLTLTISGAVSAGFFPAFVMNDPAPSALAAYACHAAICIMPLALDLREDAIWRSLKSEI